MAAVMQRHSMWFVILFDVYSKILIVVSRFDESSVDASAVFTFFYLSESFFLFSCTFIFINEYFIIKRKQTFFGRSKIRIYEIEPVLRVNILIYDV